VLLICFFFFFCPRPIGSWPFYGQIFFFCFVLFPHFLPKPGSFVRFVDSFSSSCFLYSPFATIQASPAPVVVATLPRDSPKLGLRRSSDDAFYFRKMPNGSPLLEAPVCFSPPNPRRPLYSLLSVVLRTLPSFPFKP